MRSTATVSTTWGTMAVAATLLVSAPAAGQPDDDATQDQCVAAHLDNQKLRQQGELQDARQQLVFCAQDACPPPIRTECVGWLGELDAQMPTVVIGAKDKAGKDTSAVRVSVDGKLVAEQLDGRPMSIDPGPHEVTCIHDRKTRVEKVVIAQGKKNRPITCSFEEQVAAPVVEAEGAPVGQLVAGIVIGVVGLGGVATFAALGTIGKSEAADLDVACREGMQTPDCTTKNIDSTEAKLLAADIALVAGVALTAVSLGLVIHWVLSEPDDEESALRWDVHPTPGGAFGNLSVSF